MSVLQLTASGMPLTPYVCAMIFQVSALGCLNNLGPAMDEELFGNLSSLGSSPALLLPLLLLKTRTSSVWYEVSFKPCLTACIVGNGF